MQVPGNKIGVELPTAPRLQVSQDTTVKEGKVHTQVDAGEFARELCTRSANSWNLICFQGWTVSELCGTTF